MSFGSLKFLKKNKKKFKKIKKNFNKPIHPPALAQAQTHRISTTFFFDPGVTPFLALMYLDMLN